MVGGEGRGKGRGGQRERRAGGGEGRERAAASTVRKQRETVLVLNPLSQFLLSPWSQGRSSLLTCPMWKCSP